MSPARPYIAHRVVAAGHVLFTQGVLNLNLIGVRSASRAAGRFDDRLYAVWRDEAGNWCERSWPITTDPGAYYSLHPLNAKGTARLVAGQYRGAWVIGKHKGRYPALVQDRPVTVYRDADLDLELDDDVPTETGMFGINIHAATNDPFGTDRESTDVGRWSAGCQVFAKAVDYREFWAIVLRSADVWGPRYSYTLLED